MGQTDYIVDRLAQITTEREEVLVRLADVREKMKSADSKRSGQSDTPNYKKWSGILRKLEHEHDKYKAILTSLEAEAKAKGAKLAELQAETNAHLTKLEENYKRCMGMSFSERASTTADEKELFREYQQMLQDGEVSEPEDTEESVSPPPRALPENTSVKPTVEAEVGAPAPPPTRRVPPPTPTVTRIVASEDEPPVETEVGAAPPPPTRRVPPPTPTVTRIVANEDEPPVEAEVGAVATAQTETPDHEIQRAETSVADEQPAAASEAIETPAPEPAVATEPSVTPTGAPRGVTDPTSAAAPPSIETDAKLRRKQVFQSAMEKSKRSTFTALTFEEANVLLTAYRTMLSRPPQNADAKEMHENLSGAMWNINVQCSRICASWAAMVQPSVPQQRESQG